MPKSSRRKTTGFISTATNCNLEEMIAYIRQNPEVAQGVHHHLSQAKYLQQINAPLESSTPQMPKRNLDSSENDDLQVAKQQRALSNEKRNNQYQSLTTERQHRNLLFDHLKHAVSSNLPCFLIESEQGGSSKNRSSDIVAADTIENHFKQQGIPITFSLVGHTSNKLKLGVNNKESYATLMSTDKWPTQVNNVNITVIEPKFMPDAFALVVRYVPLQYDDDYVREEIEHNLESVENVRRIQYRFQHRTNDFRFIVKDLREYNSMLKLGRISIENTFCIVTPFPAGNRMTFCTRRWCLGHMREKCNLEYPRCRICLDSLITGKIHNCSNTARCAQCNGNHHSLCSECQKVMEYRSDLKEQVNNAIAAGKLHRAIPQDCVQSKQSQMKQSK